MKNWANANETSELVRQSKKGKICITRISGVEILKLQVVAFNTYILSPSIIPNFRFEQGCPRKFLYLHHITFKTQNLFRLYFYTPNQNKIKGIT